MFLAICLRPLKIDKLIPALVMMALVLAGVAFGINSFEQWFDPGSHSRRASQTYYMENTEQWEDGMDGAYSTSSFW